MSLDRNFSAKARPAWMTTVEQIAGRDLPLAQVSVHPSSDTGASFSIKCAAGRQRFFSADDCCIDRQGGRLTIARDRESEVRVTDKGAGLGKIFLRNMLDIGEALGLRKVDMRAGREDGAWYWSFRGAHLESGPGTVPYGRFVDRVRHNMQALPAPVIAQVEAMLDTPGADLNARLARVPGDVNGKPVGAALLDGTNPTVVFHLDDPAQMEAVRQKLGDVGAAAEAAKLRYASAPAGPGPGVA